MTPRMLAHQLGRKAFDAGIEMAHTADPEFVAILHEEGLNEELIMVWHQGWAEGWKASVPSN